MSIALVNVTQQMITALMQKSGCSPMECKKALTHTNANEHEAYLLLLRWQKSKT